MSDCKPVRTSFEPGMKFNVHNEEETLSGCPYQQAIGSLLYVAQGTRPDISFAVNTLSRFNKNPTTAHWSEVKRIFRYLQGTKDLKLLYTRDGDEKITGYCDADWASDVCYILAVTQAADCGSIYCRSRVLVNVFSGARGAVATHKTWSTAEQPNRHI